MRSTKLIRLLLAAVLAPCSLNAAPNQILGWNNLGMHCMDSDYSVFSVLPPYNTIHAQLIVGGKLVTNLNGYSVTYEAVADPDGSFNSTSRGKTGFYEHLPRLFNLTLPVDAGLPVPGPDPFWMPGTNNVPQAMRFETTFNWLAAYGVPITPYDDGGRKNPYPLMRLIARSGTNQPIATNDIVLPVSDEMDCRACHASGTQGTARPAAGWVWSSNPERDYRLNLLRLHDERLFASNASLYSAALATNHFNPAGLYRGVVADGQPVLCAQCHVSEALGTAGFPGVRPLTAAVHAKHASMMDPDLQITLDNSAHRAACYRCHPGSATKCLRGAMGGAIASDGTMAMQCQNCHGNMSAVGSTNRTGWLMEPNCQSCHTGTAMSNNGLIRYTSCFETNGMVRVATNQVFATSSNTPAAHLSLYRFSAGHGKLQCSACHGSTHAEFPATHRNDNLRNIALQGHAGVMIECTACHVSMSVNSTTLAGGPHGMHPIGQNWADNHGDLIEDNSTLRNACRNCHGADFKGTVLSRVQSDRVIPTNDNKYGTKTFSRGHQVSCYDCHDGANSESGTTHPPPAVVHNTSTNTTSATPVHIALQATGGGGMTFRVVSQPAHGAVGVSSNLATYFPDPGFVGTNQFIFAAWNGWTESNLGTGTVVVAQGLFSITAKPYVPAKYPANWPVPFGVIAIPSNVVGTVHFAWTFGDGSPAQTNQFTTHAFASPGVYPWRVICSVTGLLASASVTNTGVIAIDPEETLRVSHATDALLITWPNYEGDALLEWSHALGSGAAWSVDTNSVNYSGPNVTVREPNTGSRFYRLRKL